MEVKESWTSKDRYEESRPGVGLSAERPVLRYVGADYEQARDDLPVEEPLQIRMAGEDVAVTMRTPGHDAELTVGFLLSEGIIGGKHHVESIAYCVGEDGLPAPNIINVLPTDRNLLNPQRWRRNTYASSSCGLCGKVSIEQVARTDQAPGTSDGAETWTVGVGVFYLLEEKLREAQAGFSLTGGLHAAGLFDLDGALMVVREDVGRHNAVDKVIGYGLMQNMLPLDKHILLVSSRASFEIVQKALAAGLRAMAVLSAPSSLAVDLALESGMTLVAFLRNGRMNVYSGEERLRR